MAVAAARPLRVLGETLKVSVVRKAPAPDLGTTE